jgi:hypothetical protein
MALAAAAISHLGVNLTEPYGSEKHCGTPGLLQPVMGHHEKLDSFEDHQGSQRSDHLPDLDTVKHWAPNRHRTDRDGRTLSPFIKPEPFNKPAEDAAICTSGEAEILSVGYHSGNETLYGELNIIDTPAVTPTGPYLERLHSERVRTRAFSS